jgi:ABC-2 type transport system ATP-binding protein
MHTLEISHIAKSFGATQAVVDVSFEVQSCEIFGLLGPNGAGKTTTIRVLLDLFKPDSGSASVLGGPMTEEKKNRIGYMPEERGLYQDISLDRCLLYLASLKDVPASEARKRVNEYLERFDLDEHRNKKVKELSKGMQQKAQLISTVLHRPDLIIIDEPFAALDPLNVQLVKDLLQEMRAQGATILMSTHQMQQVEELCDRILLIDRGRDVLYGCLDEIRRRYSGHAVLVRPLGELPALEGVKEICPQNGDLKLTLAEEIDPQEVLYALTRQGIMLEKFEIAISSLDEVFIRVVEGSET